MVSRVLFPTARDGSRSATAWSASRTFKENSWVWTKQSFHCSVSCPHFAACHWQLLKISHSQLRLPDRSRRCLCSSLRALQAHQRRHHVRHRHQLDPVQHLVLPSRPLPGSRAAKSSRDAPRVRPPSQPRCIGRPGEDAQVFVAGTTRFCEAGALLGDGRWRVGSGSTDQDRCSAFQDESVKAGVCSPVWSQRPFESFVVMIAV